MSFIYKLGVIAVIILGCCEYSLVQSKVLTKVLTYCEVYTYIEGGGDLCSLRKNMERNVMVKAGENLVCKILIRDK